MRGEMVTVENGKRRMGKQSSTVFLSIYKNQCFHNFFSCVIPLGATLLLGILSSRAVCNSLSHPLLLIL